jgi:hypothetical protein
MKNKYSLLIIFFSIICFSLSCIDIFEADLSSSAVDLIAPADSLTTISNSQRFWWNNVEGALWYELQVARPSFSEVSELNLDTLIEKNNFQFSLQPGVYHWRVRAYNGSSTTGYTENMLQIIDSI